MPIEIKMPALSPTMETGTLAKWHVKEGDKVEPGDLLAEIETDKATMEFEAVDEGVIEKITVAAGSADIKVGQVIAVLSGEGEAPTAEGAPANGAGKAAPIPAAEAPPSARQEATPVAERSPDKGDGKRLRASPLARRIAGEKGIDLASVRGSGPNGRIVKADLDEANAPIADALPSSPKAPPVVTSDAPSPTDYPVPHDVVKLSSMRKTIARRLSESKQQVPHIYLTLDIRLDALLKLRAELNDALAARGVKLSVNDLLIKALGVALERVPECNVQFRGDEMLTFRRADISVAVSIPGGLITPIIVDAGGRSLAAISKDMKDLAERAKAGKLKPEEYLGGTASLSNMGMMGIKQFDAVINPPQAMILAVGAGERRPWVMPDDSLAVATVMSATGSFDHRAIDGADGARLMSELRNLIEKPLGMLA